MLLNPYNLYVFNRPNVAGAVLQTPSSLIDWLIWLAVYSKSSKRFESQTVETRELKFWENVHPKSSVMCHMSCVTCQLSPGSCYMYFFFTFKVVELVSEGSV